jgi:benzodiazapine receptor
MVHLPWSSDVARKLTTHLHATCNHSRSMTTRKLAVGAAIFGGAVAGTALVGGLFNPTRGGTRDWYRELEKPPFNPPDAVFGPVWTLLYVLIAVSGYRVWASDAGRDRTRALALWGVQLVLNAAWSPLFFGAKRPALALADILLMLAAIAAYTAAARKVDKPAAWLMSPYLAWVAFATLLNAEIVRRNAA